MLSRVRKDGQTTRATHRRTNAGDRSGLSKSVFRHCTVPGGNMALTLNVSLRRPDTLSHAPFLGLRTTSLPCLRDFRSSSIAPVPVYRHCTRISCVVTSSEHASRHPSGLPQAHITALDNRAGVEDLLSLLRTKQKSRSSGPGTVYLAGTGPGDPGLLTLRAVQLMQTADVVLYDRLVSPDILRLVHGGARMVYVGKQKGFHTRTQDEIHELLCHFAMEGSSVLRLKGGDPFVFGRGGEEVQYLQQRNISTHVIPGITAASGICAELGIPLTHRGIATSVRFLTGHSREGDEAQLDESIAACADPHTTLVVYMGLGTLPTLTQQLTSAGLSPGTPAVAIERGTTSEQRTVWAPVDHLCDDVEEAKLQSPTLVIIGEVVGLAKGWRHADNTGQEQRASWSEFRQIWESAQQEQQPSREVQQSAVA